MHLENYDFLGQKTKLVMPLAANTLSQLTQELVSAPKDVTIYQHLQKLCAVLQICISLLIINSCIKLRDTRKRLAPSHVASQAGGWELGPGGLIFITLRCRSNFSNVPSSIVSLTWETCQLPSMEIYSTKKMSARDGGEENPTAIPLPLPPSW